MNFTLRKSLKKDSARGKFRLWKMLIKLKKQLKKVINNLTTYKKLQLKTFQ